MAELTEAELELLDPHPDIHDLFVHYNSLYFDSQLGACSVEWSSARMTLCGGVCEWRPGGGCRIKLSEPLLKLRPSRDLKMVLLHEMIHASMMLQGIRDDDSGGHGTIFKSIMARINTSILPDHQRPPGGYNITTTHSMFAEVDHYRQHHWRCERCGNVIKRAMNRAPQEADCRLHVRGRDCGDAQCRYHMHVKHCGGVWVKVKEPEGFTDKQQKKPKKGGRGGKAGSGGNLEAAARHDGGPLPAKRPKKGAGAAGAGGRPITDFFPSTGPASPSRPSAVPVAGGGAGGQQSRVAATTAAAVTERGSNSGGGGAVLPAIQAVADTAAAAVAHGGRFAAGRPCEVQQEEKQQQRQQQRRQPLPQQQPPQQQQQQQPPPQKQQQQPPQQQLLQEQAEPSVEERRRLLAEAALRRLGGAAGARSEQQQARAQPPSGRQERCMQWQLGRDQHAQQQPSLHDPQAPLQRQQGQQQQRTSQQAPRLHHLQQPSQRHDQQRQQEERQQQQEEQHDAIVDLAGSSDDEGLGPG